MTTKRQRRAPTRSGRIVRQRAAAVEGITGRIGGHSLRVGSARELAADGASLVELQQAGGWRSPTTPAVYVRPGRSPALRGEAVARPDRGRLQRRHASTFLNRRRAPPEPHSLMVY